MQICFIAAHDSEFKLAAKIAHQFHEKGWSTSFITTNQMLNTSQQQLIDCGVDIDQIKIIEDKQLFEHVDIYDAAMIILPGPIIERFLFKYRSYRAKLTHHKKRPVIATAFVGINIRNICGAFLKRASADIICVNSQADYNAYADICEQLHIDKCALRLTGLGIMPSNITPKIFNTTRKILFADQVAIPKNIKDRMILYTMLYDTALACPETQFVIKPRHRPGDVTSHKGQYAVEQFFKNKKMPANLIIDYTPIIEHFHDTDLLITISSTAAFEALAYGVKAAILADLGVDESYGNHIFLQSGLIRTLNEVAQGDIGTPDPAWLALYTTTGDPAVCIYHEIATEVRRKMQSGNYDFPHAPYFESRSSFFLYQKSTTRRKKSKRKNYLTDRIKKYGVIRGYLYRFGELYIPPIFSSKILKVLKLIKIY